MIAVECFPDEVLVRAFGIPVARILHAKGKGNVINAVIQNRASAGLIDEDPDSTQPSVLGLFRTQERNGSLILMQHRDSADRRLVVICPRLEDWLLNRAEACSIGLHQYGLPETAEDLKRKRYDRFPKYRGFLDQLLSSDDEFKVLKKWLTET